jgi:hypothetical protein
MLQLHSLCLVSSGAVALLFCLFLCRWSLALVVLYMCFRVSPKISYVFFNEKNVLCTSLKKFSVVWKKLQPKKFISV